MNAVYVYTSILAAAVVIGGGVWRLVRASIELTAAIRTLTVHVERLEKRSEQIEERVDELELRRRSYA